MTTLLAFYLIGMSIFIVALMAWQHINGTHRLLTLRNFALVGLVVFQSGSGALHLYLNDYHVYAIQNPARTGLIFCTMLTVFLVLFLVSYQVGWPVKNLAKHLPKTRFSPTSGALILMACVFTAAGTALKLTVDRSSAASIISALGLGLGCGSMACGLMAWVWGRNFLNPFVIAMTGGVFLFNAAVSMIGGFGRRPLVALGAAMLWGLFYSKLRFMRPMAVFRLLALAAIPPVMMVAMFTAARASDERDRSVADQLRAMGQGDLKKGIEALAGGQATAAGSLFVIEHYPEQYQGTFLHSFWMVFLHPIPRSIWQDKPIPISTLIAKQAHVQGVAVDEISLPPGIVGYAAAEGGWIALVVYGVFFGLFMRFFDELVTLNPYTPMIVLPVGTQLGQIIGVFRGEPSLFAATYWMTVVIFYGMMVMLSKMFEGRMTSGALGDGVEHDPMAWGYDDVAGETPYDVEVDSYSGYGDYSEYGGADRSV